MGPTFLKNLEKQWPVFKIPECKTADVDSEIKGNNVMLEASLLSREDLSREIPLLNLSDINESRCSSLLKLIKVTAWVLRFVNNQNLILVL